MWILEKLSSPGWIKKFSTELLAQQKLQKHLCKDCRKEAFPLRSSCSLEYEIYDEEAGPSRRFFEISVDSIENAITDGGSDMTGEEFADRLLGKTR
jgi:hypothetical protein